MAGTIIDYLKKYGDQSFAEMPMNEVDSLILCQLSYLKFDGMVPDVSENSPSVTLTQIAAHADYEKLYADERYEKSNRALFEGMLAGKRFRDLKLNCYVNIIEKEWETQFSAVTCILSDGTLYIAFRGTDESIVGWKEDFNMAFLSPVPGQAYSVKYLNQVTGKLHSPFYVGGHSKGGNLAVYSAMCCADSVKERIRGIYSMDGPGFRPEVLQEHDYEAIADKVIKIMPHSSVVGMLFEQDHRYEVVESKTFGLAQHNPYTWKVTGDHFQRAEDIHESVKRLDNTINEWVLSLNNDQLKIFVNTLFEVLGASKAENLIDFTADWKKSMTGMVAALKEVDEDTISNINQIIKALFEIGAARIRHEMSHKRLKAGGQSKSKGSRRSRKKTAKEQPALTE